MRTLFRSAAIMSLLLVAQAARAAPPDGSAPVAATTAAVAPAPPVATIGPPIAVNAPTGAHNAPDPAADPTAFLDAIANAARAGHWRLFVGLVLIGFIWLIRAWGGAVVPWLRTDRGGAVTALAVGVAGAFSAELMDHAPITLSFFLDGIALGCTAAGGWVVIRRIFGGATPTGGPLAGTIADPSRRARSAGAGPTAFLALLVPLVAFAQGCTAPMIDAARKSVAAADQVETASVGAFTAFDLAHQRAIAEKGAPDAHAQLDAYRASRAKVLEAFRLLADASHAARGAIDATEAGQSGQLDLSAVFAAARALRDAAAVVGFAVPGLDPLMGGAP
jgi:hypothetical protein